MSARRKDNQGEKRLDRWREPKPVLLVRAGDHIPNETPEADANKSATISLTDFVRPAKELIFDVVDGRPVFHLVLYGLNVDSDECFIQYMFDITHATHNEEETKEAVKSLLIIAQSNDVPVYPNDASSAAALLEYYRDFLLHGCVMATRSGQYYINRDPKLTALGSQALEALSPLAHHSPAEIGVIRESVLQELARYQTATRALQQLTGAIADLRKQLGAGRRCNEARLQRVLTQNPILFGPDYVRVIPKHRLGSEYEMDYALERVSGLVDLVEIEASSHKLFTTKGDPSAVLVHAERQVLDWLEWIESHTEYARAGLPGLYEPTGFVVIGRRETLSPADRGRLRRRNTAFRYTLQILTYDDVLERANNLLRLLQGSAAQAGAT